MQNKLFEEFHIVFAGKKLIFEGEDAPIVKSAYKDAVKNNDKYLSLKKLTFSKGIQKRELNIVMNNILYVESFLRETPRYN